MIWTLRYLDCIFRLRYILLGLDWKPFGQGFIIILTRYFTGAGLGNTWTWTTNFDYNYYVSQHLDFKVPRLWFGFRLLFALLYRRLGLENTWTVNLDCDY